MQDSVYEPRSFSGRKERSNCIFYWQIWYGVGHAVEHSEVSEGSSCGSRAKTRRVEGLTVVNFLFEFFGDPRTISVVALVVALYSATLSLRTRKKLLFLQTEIAERQLRALRESEEASTKPVVDVFMRHIGGSIYHMIIQNTGPVPALDVNLEIIDSPGHRSPLNTNDVNEKLPIKSLAPEEECPLVAGCSNGHWPPFRCQAKLDGRLRDTLRYRETRLRSINENRSGSTVLTSC